MVTLPSLSLFSAVKNWFTFGGTFCISRKSFFAGTLPFVGFCLIFWWSWKLKGAEARSGCRGEEKGPG